MTELQNRFIKNLKTIMKQRNLSGYELSRKSGLSSAAISRILNGLISPSMDSIHAIVSCLEVQPGDLLNDGEAHDRVSGIPSHLIPLLKGHDKMFYDAIEAMAKISKRRPADKDHDLR